MFLNKPNPLTIQQQKWKDIIYVYSDETKVCRLDAKEEEEEEGW